MTGYFTKKLNVGDNIVVNKTIIRKEGTYAVMGDIGTIIDIFVSFNGKHRKRKINAKCSMADSSIKTFRLTSLDLCAGQLPTTIKGNKNGN